MAFDLANDCRDLKKNKVALAIYQKVAESWPGTDEAIDSQTNTAKLYISLKDDPNAEAAIGRLLTDFDQHNLIIRSIEDVANAWVEARRHEKAGELYKYIVKHWASGEWAVEAQTRLARMYIQIGDYEKADASAAELIESFSNAEGIAAAVEDVADMYQMVGSQAKSYPLHRYVVEHWPEHERAIWCQMKAIMSQLRLGDLAKAEEDLGRPDGENAVPAFTVDEDGRVRLWRAEVHSMMSMEELWETRPAWNEQLADTFSNVEKHDLRVWATTLEREDSGFRISAQCEPGHGFNNWFTGEHRTWEVSFPCYECGRTVQGAEDPLTQHEADCPLLLVTEVMDS